MIEQPINYTTPSAKYANQVGFLTINYSQLERKAVTGIDQRLSKKNRLQSAYQSPENGQSQRISLCDCGHKVKIADDAIEFFKQIQVGSSGLLKVKFK